MPPLSIVLADDHALVRDGIKTLLEDEDDLRVVGEADDGRAAIDLVEDLGPDLLIVDIRMPRLNGIDAVRALKSRRYPVQCLVLSMHDSEEYVLQSIDAGADGYLLKDANREEFLKATRAVGRGERYFSGDLSNILLKQLTAGGMRPLAQGAPGPARSGAAVAESGAAVAETGTPADGTAPERAPAVELTRREREVLGQVLLARSNQEIADELGLSRRTVETHRFNMMKKLGVSNSGELVRRARELGL